MINNILLFVLISFLYYQCFCSEHQNNNLYKIKGENALEELRKNNFDVLLYEGDVYLYETKESIQSIETYLKLEYEEAPKEIKTKLIPEQPPTGYRDLNELEQELKSIAENYPEITLLLDITEVYGEGPTVDGRPVFALKISDNPNEDEDEPNVMILSEAHAREICTPEVGFDTIDTLLNGYQNDPSIKALVDTTQIWVVPLFNPDGYNWVFEQYNMWRKNRRLVASNTYGVDLNRNWDLNWSASCGGSSSPSSDTYRGPSSMSEQETRALAGLAETHHFDKFLEFHQSGAEVLYAYQCAPMETKLRTFTGDRAKELADEAGYITRRPSADGEQYEYHFSKYTLYSFLVEMGTSGFQPSYSACMNEVAIVKPLVQRFLDYKISLEGHVYDTNTNLPLKARVFSDAFNFNLEERYSNSKFGRYSLVLPEGSVEVSFIADGYYREDILVDISAGVTLEKDVFLRPLGEDST